MLRPPSQRELESVLACHSQLPVPFLLLARPPSTPLLLVLVLPLPPSPSPRRRASDPASYVLAHSLAVSGCAGLAAGRPSLRRRQGRATTRRAAGVAAGELSSTQGPHYQCVPPRWCSALFPLLTCRAGRALAPCGLWSSHRARGGSEKARAPFADLLRGLARRCAPGSPRRGRVSRDLRGLLLLSLSPAASSSL